jgi:putative transcriptional regulator
MPDVPEPGSSANMEPGPLQGKLLVASPALADPNFSRTVVLLLAHGDQGGLGLVLNRSSVTGVASPLPQWEDLASSPAVVFVGGPVSEGAICLARVKSEVSVPSSGFLPLRGTLGTVDLESDPAFVAPWIEKLRIFAGYAGWGPGQLEAEMGAGAWWAFDAEDDDIFSSEPDDLWKRVLRRQGGRWALVSAYPEDPSLN